MSLVLGSLDDPRLGELLLSGKIGVVPTDTVYGLVGCATSQDAIERLYDVKTRARQPGTTIAANADQLVALGFPSESVQIASKFWPGAVSVEMSAENIPDYLKSGQKVMAARVPDSRILATLLEITGPLMTTSANAPGEPTSTTIEMAQDYFGDSIDFYVDGGDLGGRPSSTIIGIDVNSKITVYRHGAVEITE